MEWIFDNPDKYILQESRDNFSRCPKIIRNCNFFKALNFSALCSSAHVEFNFDNPWNNFGKRPDKFVQLPKMIEEVQFFWKFFPISVLKDRRIECTLTNPVKNFPQKAEKFTLTGRKWKKKQNLMRSFFPRSVPLVTLNVNFVNTVGTSYPEGRSYYGQQPMMIKKSFFLRSLSGDCYYGLWECSFLTKPTKTSGKKLGIFQWK